MVRSSGMGRTLSIEVGFGMRKYPRELVSFNNTIAYNIIIFIFTSTQINEGN